MRVDCALLCEAATVREGLLNILGGGITRAQRPSYPAPLGMAMGLRILMHPTEGQGEHVVRLLLNSEDGKPIAEVTMGFLASPDVALYPGEDLNLAVAVPLHGVAIPSAGRYSFELLIDNIHQVSVPFIAEMPPTTQGEP